MFEQLLAHLLGDYIFQTDKQAVNKTKSLTQVTIHAFTYTLAFVLFGWLCKIPEFLNPVALAIVFTTHLWIDHLRLAKYVAQFKNAIGDFPKVDFSKYNTFYGYAEGTPQGLALALFIITDNTMHLLINYVAFRYFH